MISLSKLKKGKRKEDEVEEFLEGKGWSVKKNIFYDSEGNEISQYVLIDGYPKSYPDFTIEKYKDRVYVKYLLEVKSLERYYLDGEVSLTIPCYQFLSYKDIQENEKIPAHIIFVLFANGFDGEEWYAQTLKKLNKTKKYIEDAYKDEDKHYIWNISLLEKIK